MTETIPLQLVGDNATPIWGMTNAERVGRLVRKAAEGGQRAQPGMTLFANLAFAFDPMLLRVALERPGIALTRDRELVLGQLPDDADPETLAGVETLPLEGERFYNVQLRKLEEPFAERLTPASRRGIERKSYFGAYKGVTDLLTKYLWPELALWLTRGAAQIGMTPNMVTAIGGAMCVAATFLFAGGYYWTGLLAGFIFMVLDTVDGKLARCTVTSSKIGNALDHGLDLIHPPFWWYAWGVGLSAQGLALDDWTFGLVMAAVLTGYVVQRLIEGVFLARFKLDCHTWRPFDSRFRLFTARRNPNMVILFVSLILGRPDWGLIAVAWWTMISLGVHGVRLVQAMAVARREGGLRSWMEQAA